MKPGLNIGQIGELSGIVDPTMTIILGALSLGTGALARAARASRAGDQTAGARGEGQLPKRTHRADSKACFRCRELPDAQEGMAAFTESRKPKIHGRYGWGGSSCGN